MAKKTDNTVFTQDSVKHTTNSRSTYIPTPRSTGLNSGWLSVSSVAQYLDTTQGSVRNMVYRGQIPYCRMGKRLLFKKSDIDRLLERTRNGGYR